MSKLLLLLMPMLIIASYFSWNFYTQRNITYAQNKGVKLWSQHFGDSKNPAVILTHGAGLHSAFWYDDFCQKIADGGYFVIKWDMRDSGYSTHLPMNKGPMNGPYPFRALTDDFIAVLDAYGIKKAHAIGHSLGGYMMECIAAEHSDRVLTATSLGGGPFLGKEQFDAMNLGKMTKENEAVLFGNRPTGDLQKDLPGWIKSYKLLQGDYPFNEKMAEELTKQIYTRNIRDAQINWNHIATFLDPAFGTDLSKINCPFLVVHGETDPIQLKSYGQATADLIPNSELIVIPEYGHVFFNEIQWKYLTKIFLDFLNKNK